MYYITLDLEWNQAYAQKALAIQRRLSLRLRGEVIQIGAVKVGENFEVVDSISIPIRPTHYVKIHPRIRKMTQLGAEELADAPQFLEAMDQFAAWCGEDYTLLTWGCDDISVVRQNRVIKACPSAKPKNTDTDVFFHTSVSSFPKRYAF